MRLAGSVFSKLTRQSLKRGVFRSVDDLETAITRYIAATNRNPKPFVWTATAKAIATKLALNHPSESVHQELQGWPSRRSEPPRVSRRPLGLGHAAKAWASACA